ncbi:MAG: hypothetical protein RL346_2159 [Verrucomicrobiota bacterium]
MNPLMKHLALAMLVIIPLGPTHAELPTIDKEPWSSYFMIMKQRKFQFGIMPDASTAFHPLTKRGEIISESNPIIFKIEILETKSDGKTTSRKINPESLRSAHAPAFNPQKPVTISGTATGEIHFEVTFAPQRDGFDVSGRITDQGKSTNPLNLAVKVGLRPYVKDKTRTLEESKHFNQRTKRDVFEAVIASGNRKSYKFNQNANFVLDMPDGAESLRLRAEAYDSTEFHVVATGGAKIHFDDKNQLVSDGIDFRWISPKDAGPGSHYLKFSTK